MDPYLLDALKFHIARCLQLANKSKTELCSVIISENIRLCEKITRHLGYPNVSSATKSSKKLKVHKRRMYEERLSGPESGNEDIR
ncbi:hypothetical protein ACP4OV_012664 [Aristida adscensionis]